MRFNLIHTSLDSNGNKNKINVWFAEACKKYNLEFVGYDVSGYGESLFLSKLQTLNEDDLIYRSSTGHPSVTMGRVLMNDKVTSFYTKWESVNASRISSWFTHVKYGLPVVPSFPCIPSNKTELEDVVEKLGSFPIIVKAVGGSLGVGVMRIDSMKSLQSILDYFKANKTNVMLRKYIEHDYYVRAVVVGDDVVASHAAYTMDGEFRTNAGDDTDQKRKIVDLKDDVKRDVVKAVHVLGIETGGVDLLFDKEDKHYIAEVNFPNNFSVTQKVTGVNIAEKMLEYLIEKNKKRKQI